MQLAERYSIMRFQYSYHNLASLFAQKPQIMQNAALRLASGYHFIAGKDHLHVENKKDSCKETEWSVITATSWVFYAHPFLQLFS